jgi:hypothetical protein
VASFAELNEAAKRHTDFHIKSFDGHRLVLVGSFDLCYYHYIEVHFVEVDRIDCLVWFDCPTFSDEGPVNDPGSAIAEPRRFVIQTDGDRHEIIARSVEVVLGMVYYYDRGAQLQPGERIAEWVKRANAETSPCT